MSQLLEVLGRGLISRLSGAFDSVVRTSSDEDLGDLKRLVESHPDDLDAAIRAG